MTLRVSQGVIKSALAAGSNPNVSTVALKAVVTAGSDIRVSGAVIKAAVRTYKKVQVAKITPPVNLTMICSCNPVCCFTF